MKKIIPPGAVLIPDEAECVFRGVLFDVWQWDSTLYDGSKGRFEMLHRNDTVRVIAVIDDKILVLDESQPNHNNNLTFPGGRIELDDESVLDAAMRELFEETGYKLSHWRLVDVTQPESKIERFVYTYIAWGGIHHSDSNHDPGEQILTRLLSYNEVYRLAQDGVGYIGRAGSVILPATSIQDLLATPGYAGRIVDRS